MMKIFKPHQAGKTRKRGQAMVEFSLTIIIFLMLLVMIFEVARMMQVLLTLQHAARMGARYAVTGDFYTKYNADPLAGWDMSGTSDDPLDRIPPCWPRFYDDLVAPTLPSTDFYEPFRDARTCSIEEVTIEAMQGLNLDPHALPGQPAFYNIVVRGVGDAVTPDTDITRYINEPTHILYGTLPAEKILSAELIGYGYDYANAGQKLLYPGFGGQPNQSAVLQIEYRYEIATPILRDIASSIRLTGQAKMTNESFGSTSSMRDSVLPPSLPPIPTLGLPVPADLVINEFNTATTGTVNPGSNISFNTEVANIGGLDAAVAGGFNARVFAYDPDEGAGEGPLTALELADISEGIMAPPGIELTPVIANFTNLLAGSSTNAVITYTVPAAAPGGIYYFYMMIDGSDVIDEDGFVGTANYDIARERNNMASLANTLVIGAEIDLDATSLIPQTQTPDPGTTVTFDATVYNHGPNSSVDTYVMLLADGDTITNYFSLNGASSAGCSTDPGGFFICDLAELINGGSKTATFALDVTGAVGSQLEIYAFADYNGTAIEQAANRPNNESDHINVYIGAVDLNTDITVDNAKPSLGDILTYTVSVENDSPNEATGVLVEINNTPNGLIAFDTTSPWIVGGGSISLTEPDRIRWYTASIPGNTTVEFTFEAEVLDVNGNVLTEADITSTHFDVNTGNDHDSVLVKMQTADLSVTKSIISPSNGLASEFDEVTFRVTVNNNPASDANATDVIVTDELPEAFEYDEVNNPAVVTTGTVTYDDVNRVFTWDNFDINVGGSERLTYTVTVVDDAHITYGDATNTAEVTSATADDTLDNNTDDAYIEFVLLADLQLNVTADQTDIQSGQTVVYTITATNNSSSPSTATDVEVTGILDGTEADSFASITGDLPEFDETTGIWTIGDMLPGDSLVLTVTAVSNDTQATNPAIINAQMNIASPVTDPYLWNNDDSWYLKIFDFGIFVNLGDVAESCTTVTEWGWDLEYGFDWMQDASTQTIKTVTVTQELIGTETRSLLPYAPPDSTWRAPDENLVQCYAEADLRYSFENLQAGDYKIVVMVARDKMNKTYSMDAYYQLTGETTWTRFVSNFDCPMIQRYYIQESNVVTITEGGSIRLYVQATGQRNARIRGIGIYMVDN